MNDAQVNAVQDDGFDLDTVDALADATHKVGIKFNDEGDPTVGFVIAGKNSDEYIAVQRKLRVESVMRSNKRKKDLDATTEEGASVVIDTINKNDRTLALAVVVGWFGFTRSGVSVPFDKKVLAGLFDKSPQWQNAILVALENEANFLPTKSDV